MNKKEYEVVHFITDLECFEEVCIDGEDLQALREYLKRCENLQEEYEKEHYLVDKLTRQLNDEYKNTEYQCKQKEDYKLRIDKAINDMQEYIDKQYKDTSDIDISIVNFWIDLLQGSDE